MKALTVCQPYAELPLLPDTDPRAKRVENRTWRTSYRGPLYIHAGKSREWLETPDGDETPEELAELNYGIPLDRMRFGMVIGVARLVHCAHIDDIRVGRLDRAMPWLRKHQHAEGPWCWIIDSPAAIGPWPWKGAQGLFEIPDGALDKVANRALGLPF